MLRKKIGILILPIFLSACAANKNIYEWGSYQTQVYNHFEHSTPSEEQIEKLESDLSKAQGSTKAIAPGFHAHLGLLYHLVGNAAKGSSHFEQEKSLYPESSNFINFLLTKQTALQKSIDETNSNKKQSSEHNKNIKSNTKQQTGQPAINT